MAAIRGSVTIITEADIVNARREARIGATAMGFGITDVTRIVTATSELARNIYRYAGEGVMHWQIIENASRKGIELIFTDHGPGIEDVDKAMTVGFTTKNGMGMGLPGSKKLMDEMTIDTSPEKGCIVRVVKWLRG